MNAIFGQKTEQIQRFSEDGKRVPVTVLRVPDVAVMQVKTVEKDGYTAVQLGIDTVASTKLNKPALGHIKASGAKAPLFLREVRLKNDETIPQVGETLNVAEILEPGDIVWVTGTSKGKGFAGGVKRYGFRGGPRTHGQSDRERAPGSIGQTTTPGRVYKGKRMAGNMGNEQVTVKNITVVAVKPEENVIMLAGLVPGFIGSYVQVVKMGSLKKFTPLLKNASEQAKADEIAAKEAEEAAKAQAEAERIAAEAASTSNVAEETASEDTTPEVTADNTEAPAAEEKEAETTEVPVAAEETTEEKEEAK